MWLKLFNRSFENLRTIRFAGELLPKWAHLLDVAAILSALPELTRQWFSRFTQRSGVEDSRIIVEHCEKLRTAIVENKKAIATELNRKEGDKQSDQILAAWVYSLDTMIQSTTGKVTCSWVVEGSDESDETDFGGGEIGLRRV